MGVNEIGFDPDRLFERAHRAGDLAESQILQTAVGHPHVVIGIQEVGLVSDRHFVGIDRPLVQSQFLQTQSFFQPVFRGLAVFLNFIPGRIQLMGQRSALQIPLLYKIQFRLLQVFSRALGIPQLLEVQNPQLIIRLGKIGLHADRVFESHPGGGVQPILEAGMAQHVIRLGETVQFLTFFFFAQPVRVLITAQVIRRKVQPVIGDVEILHSRHGLFHRSESLGLFSQHPVGGCQIVINLRNIGFDFEGFAVVIHLHFILAHAPAHVTQQVIDRVSFRFLVQNI